VSVVYVLVIENLISFPLPNSAMSMLPPGHGLKEESDLFGL
jgi:hypothetical protein